MGWQVVLWGFVLGRVLGQSKLLCFIPVFLMLCLVDKLGVGFCY